MARSRTPLAETIIERLKQHPKAPLKTIARGIAKEMELPLENVYTRVRHYAGQAGKRSREASPETVRKPGKSGWKPQPLPKSIVEPWEPFKLDSTKRLGVLADVHVPFHSERAIGLAVAALKKAKIDTLLLNGDMGDWYSMSRFEKHPKHRDKRVELQSQRDFFKYLRGQFPKARIVFKKGNHDERWDKWVWNGGLAEFHDEPLLQLDVWLGLDKLGIEVVGDQRIVLAGRLPILHGHELPKGISNPVSPARGAFLRGYHSVMVSHSHVPGSFVAVDLFHKSMVSWSTGCLCGLTPEYARINQWAWGYAMVDISVDGTYDVTNKRIDFDGKVRGTDA